MKDLLTSLALFGAGLAALLALVDSFLTDGQKKRLSSYAVQLWNWIDDLRRKPILVRFDQGKARLILITLALFFAVIIATLYMDFILLVLTGNALVIVIAGLVLLIVIFLGTAFALFTWVLNPFLRWLSMSISQLRYLGRIFVLYAICLVLQDVLDFFIGEPVRHWASQHPTFQGNIANHQYVTAVAVAFVLVLIVAAASAFELVSVTAALVFWFTLLAMIGLSLAKVSIRISELVMRRIAESPKGPIFAVSALVGGIATVIKVFV